MITRTLCFNLLVICCQTAFTQVTIRGKVFSKETESPLPAISVYLNNTSVGSITNEKGVFILSRVPSGKFRLIASSVGYLSYDSLIDTRNVSGEIVIVLKTKPSELEGFDVLTPEPDGWKKWGKLFTDIFIGTVPMRANNCKLMNPEAIKFRMNANNTLTAYSKEPLQIMNYALGYEIKYKLEEFEYDFSTKLVNYSGYALFTDTGIKHPNRANRYASERWETYRGSLMHFMRALYANDLDVQGFEMHSLGNMSNPEKDRAKIKFAQHKDSIIRDTTSQVQYIDHDEISNTKPRHIETNTVMTVDSTDYFKKMLLQPDSVISHQLIGGDSVGFAVDSTIAGFYFPDSLEVSYKLKEIPNLYRSLSKEHKHEIYPISEFVFVFRRPVYVLKDGYYYKPYDLKITGYWAWSESMCTRLPYDYYPSKNH
jgi:CarboxypepD_reg-like domain